MKSFLIAVAGIALASSASAQTWGTNPNEHQVQGHTTNSGTYVPPHWQTNPNSTRDDNYSTRGNTNPHTGQQGTQPREKKVW